MASFICKMCGGNLEFIESESVCECDHCGRRQTVPKPDDDKKMALFERANQLRADCDFDKAAGIYEAIAAEFTEEAEAYWGLVLCKYGIEYVDDPLTRGKIPTCHRSSFNSVFDDADYKATLEHATVVQRDLYEAEAKQIESLRRAIIEVSEKEEPYDVFICFKEHDAKGDRTPDSVFAQEIYEALTEKGYRVFFSRITLENILGTEYEPYIFAALNSAKVMLAFGTSAEYYNSVWVKNEWSRFLQLIAAGEKKTLIPCYADMPIDEMPNGFSIRQAQNMAKLGWQQDLIRGVEKIIPKENKAAQEKVIIRESSNNPTVNSLLKRVFIFLEDKDWKSADEYAEKVLDIDPENAEAYLGKLMAELRISKRQYLNGMAEQFDNLVSYKKVLRYANPDLKAELEGYNEAIRKRNKYNKEKAIFDEASKVMSSARTSGDFKKAADLFAGIPDFENAAELAKECSEKSEFQLKSEIYDVAWQEFNSTDPKKILGAKSRFEKIRGFKDADELAAKCEEKSENMRKHLICTSAKHTLDNAVAANLINQAVANLETISGFENADELREKLISKKERLAEEARIKEQKEKEAREAAAKEQKTKDAVGAVFGLVIILAIIAAIAGVIYTIYYFAWGKPNGKYKDAVAYLEAGEYEEAITLFTELKKFRDTEDKLPEAKYQFADHKLENGDPDGAYELFSELAGYDTEKKQWDTVYDKEQNKQVIAAGYKDSKDRRAQIVLEYNYLAEIGDVITIGHYEQDNNTDNGKETIEWIVVAKEDGKLTLLSKDILDYQPWCKGSSGYHKTWAQSTIRPWLNKNFYNVAFTDEEKARLITTTLETDQGNGDGKVDTTEETVFLLGRGMIFDGKDEYNRDTSTIAKFIFTDSEISEYAKSISGSEADDVSPAFWIREPSSGGGAQNYSNPGSNTFSSGSGSRWSYEEGYVRPCIVLNIEK